MRRYFKKNYYVLFSINEWINLTYKLNDENDYTLLINKKIRKKLKCFNFKNWIYFKCYQKYFNVYYLF